MKLKRLIVSPELLKIILMEGLQVFQVTKNPVPKDAKIIAQAVDVNSKNFVMVIESEEFIHCKADDMNCIPELVPSIKIFPGAKLDGNESKLHDPKLMEQVPS